jgi:hypothetical protein
MPFKILEEVKRTAIGEIRRNITTRIVQVQIQEHYSLVGES